MKRTGLQHQNTGGKPIGFFGEYSGTGLLEIMALGGNHHCQSADLWQHGFAE